MKRDDMLVRDEEMKLQQLIERLKNEFNDAPKHTDVTVFTQKTREEIMKQKSLIRQKRSSSQILLSRLTSLCSFKVVSAKKCWYSSCKPQNCSCKKC